MRRAILLATAASALAFSAHAEDEPTEVGEVIVTTTRLPAPQPEVAGAYVIEADRIQDSGAVLAADILSASGSGFFSPPAAPAVIVAIRTKQRTRPVSRIMARANSPCAMTEQPKYQDARH